MCLLTDVGNWLKTGRRHRWEGSIIEEAEKLVDYKDVSKTPSECLFLKPLVFIYFPLCRWCILCTGFTMVVGFPSVQIWADLNDSEIFTCAPIERGIDESILLLFQET